MVSILKKKHSLMLSLHDSPTMSRRLPPHANTTVLCGLDRPHLHYGVLALLLTMVATSVQCITILKQATAIC